MAWSPEEADDWADEYAEIACRLVGVDGLGKRCPLTMLKRLGVARRPLPKGQLQGYFELSAKPRPTVYLSVNGTIQEVRARAAHELGHVILCICKKRMPHDESMASRIGRAVCMGRADLLFHLAVLSPAECVRLYSDMFMPSEIVRRAMEVERSRRRAV